MPRTKLQITKEHQDAIAQELADFFFGLWQKGYRKLNSKKHTPQIENNKAVAPASGFTHKGGLPVA